MNPCEWPAYTNDGIPAKLTEGVLRSFSSMVMRAALIEGLPVQTYSAPEDKWYPEEMLWGHRWHWEHQCYRINPSERMKYSDSVRRKEIRNCDGSITYVPVLSNINTSIWLKQKL